MKKYLFLIVFLFSTHIFFISCEKFIEVEPPIDRVTSNVLFSDEGSAKSAVLGIYTQMMMSTPVISSGGVTIYTGLSSDEFYNTSTLNPDITEFTNNSISPSNNTSTTDLWIKGYALLYHINSCIINLSNSKPGFPEESRNQFLGESKFWRAFIFFYLVNMYGDVPLILTPDYTKNGSMPRTPVSEVYKQIITDLEEAKSMVGISYPSEGRVRVNKLAVSAMLARIYLYVGDYLRAEAESDLVIKSGYYLLESNLNNVFNRTSKEAILHIIPVSSGFNTTEARYFIPTTASTSRPNYPFTTSFISDFETNDQRKLNWTKTKTVSSISFTYPFKYKVRDLNQPVTEYYMILRFAEQFLIRAEARTQMGMLTEAKADLDMIRLRAGLTPTIAQTKDELLLAIEKERRTELFAEWGHRWFDLKRTGRSDAVLGPNKPGWQSTDVLYPIPRGEILLNPALTQNPGY